MANENDIKLAKVILNRIFKIVAILAGLAMLLCGALLFKNGDAGQVTLLSVGSALISAVAGFDTIQEIKNVGGK